MIEIRKLAALDVAFLGSKVIIGEFLLGVLGPVALGVFIASRAHTPFQWVLAIYFLALGLNYIPLVILAVGVTRRGDARSLVADEFGRDKRQTMRNYRRGSLMLLLPLVVPVIALMQRRPRRSERL